MGFVAAKSLKAADAERSYDSSTLKVLGPIKMVRPNSTVPRWLGSMVGKSLALSVLVLCLISNASAIFGSSASCPYLISKNNYSYVHTKLSASLLFWFCWRRTHTHTAHTRARARAHARTHARIWTRPPNARSPTPAYASTRKDAETRHTTSMRVNAPTRTTCCRP